MFNPWLLLALTFVWLGTVVGAYGYGQKNERNANSAQAKVSQDKMIEKAREDAVRDMEVAQQAERQQALIDQQEMKSRHALELDIARKESERAERAKQKRTITTTVTSSGTVVRTITSPEPVPTDWCDLDAASFGLLVNSVRTANTLAAGRTPELPKSLPTDTGASGRARGDDKKVDR